MRGKCETCEFFVGMAHPRKGTCHIRSVTGPWPERDKGDPCGEWSSLAAALEREAHLQRDPPGPLDDLNVHEGERVEKSLEPLCPLPERIEEPS